MSHVRDHPGESAAVIRRLGEPAQFDPETLAVLRQGGVLPGAAVRVRGGGSAVHIAVDGVEGAVELPVEVATHVFVAR